VSGLDGPYAVTVSPDGASVYVTAFDEDAVSVFARDATSGGLTFVERHKNGEGGASGLDGARAVAVAPDGAHVYVAGELSRAVAIFARDAGTGALTLGGVRHHVYGAVDGLARPDAVVVSADGSRLFTASGFDNVVAAFARDAGSGGLVLEASRVLSIGSLSGEPGVLALALAPDAAHAYAVQSTRDLLEVVSVGAP
jgi:DNA-binding beta-propeller fold protein YncE